MARSSTEGESAVVNGVRLGYSVSGQSRIPLVLVHGSWGSRHNWDAVVPGLSEQLRVVALDRRGHSESSCPPEQGSFYEDVADVAALIKYLDLAPAWVAGDSSGAVITLKLAAARPDVLRGIIVHEPPLTALLPAGSPEAREWAAIDEGPMADVRRLLEAGDHAGAAEYFVESVALGPGAWAALPEPTRAVMTHNAPTYLDELRDPSWRTVDAEALAQFAGPVLLTIGGDTASPTTRITMPIYERLVASLPQAERLTYPDAGHIPHATHPAEYVAALVDFIWPHER